MQHVLIFTSKKETLIFDYEYQTGFFCRYMMST